MTAYPDTSIQNGALAEARVLALLVQRGCRVSTPQFTNAPYDAIVEAPDGKLLKIQIKCAWQRDDVVRADLRQRAGITDSYEEGDVDAFLVYNPHMDEAYWFDYGTVGMRVERKLSSMRKNLL